MKTISCRMGVTDFVQYGINILTGEACAYCQRLLCDLSDNGKQLIADYLSIGTECFRSNWNSTVGEDKATGSIMLPYNRENGFWYELALFIMWHIEKVDIVVEFEGTFNGFTTEEWAEKSLMWYELAAKENRVHIRSNPVIPSQPQIGGRNVHAMTGRAI